MKIAIPVDSKTVDTKVCVSFGRAPYFLIYDTETKHSDYISNHAANSQGGAGIKAAQIVVNQKVQALLTPRCGENAAKVIQGGQIKIYKTTNDSIKDNIEKFVSEKLDELDDIHPGFHGHGGE